MSEIAEEDRLQEKGLVIKVGVLELRGGYALHHNLLKKIGLSSFPVNLMMI